MKSSPKRALRVARLRRVLPNAAVLFWTGITLSCAQPYIQANLEVSFTAGDATVKRGDEAELWKTNSAKVTFGATEWWIENAEKGAPRHSHYDGTNVYIRLGKPTPSDKDFTNVGSSTTQSTTVWIFHSPGGHPLLFSLENIAWLSLCSGQYLARPGRNVPIPTATFTRHWPHNFAYSDDTRVFEDALGLPSRLELYTSHARYKQALTDPRLFRDYSPFNPEPKFRDGELQFRYVVEVTTNFNGYTIPLSFGFQSFSHIRHGGNVRGVGIVSVLQHVSRPGGIFDSPGSYTIADWRFRHSKIGLDGLIYEKTNITMAPSTNEAALRALFETRERLVSNRNRSALGVRVAIIVLVAALPVTFLLMKVLRKRH